MKISNLAVTAAMLLCFTTYAQNKSESEQSNQPVNRATIRSEDMEDREDPEEVFEENSFDWGFQLSASTQRVEIGHFGNFRNNQLIGKGIGGYSAGFFMQAQSDIFYVRPALLFTYLQGNINSARGKINFSMHKLELPVLLGLKTYDHFVLEAGPSFHQIVNITENYQAYGMADFGKTGLGYQTGLGYNSDVFYVLACYQGVTYTNPKLKHSVRELNIFRLSVGYKFGSTFHLGYALKQRRTVYLPHGKQKVRIRYFRK